MSCLRQSLLYFSGQTDLPHDLPYIALEKMSLKPHENQDKKKGTTFLMTALMWLLTALGAVPWNTSIV